MRKTKIVCTLGPATDNEEILTKIVNIGMNVARFNFSHADYAEHLERLNLLKRVREKVGKPVAALLDTKGPEIRLGLFKEGKVYLNTGDKFTLTTEIIDGDAKRATVNYSNLPNDVEIGTKILIDDGLVGLTVESKTDTEIHCVVDNEGQISNNKSINVPGANLTMPFISEKDRNDIIFATEHGYDFIAASFTRTADDIREIKAILKEKNAEHIKIIAKIENAQGVNNLDEIIEEADGIMVARGDLGVEVPTEEVPIMQKIMIKKVYDAGKIVITATQMLDSMIKNPRPTRAEATDVANAIYDGTSAIMLSGETANGKYPVEAVEMMDRIARRTESSIDYKQRLRARKFEVAPDVTNAISHATVTTAHDLNTKGIITVTKSGFTARMISKYRPECPIYACTPSETVCRQLNLSFGVIPYVIPVETQNTDELIKNALETIKEKENVASGELAVVTAGVPIGQTGTTNLLKVETF